ncbi:MAG: DUF4347 domain-containing protein, partial [Cyanobacteria bacterium J06648_11]
MSFAQFDRGYAIARPMYRSERQLVVIDPDVCNLNALIDDVCGRTDVLILDGARDGVAQVADALEQLRHVSSLHLVSHGHAASIKLGNVQLNINTFDRHIDSLERWARVLSGADLLVYSCEVAAGSMGQLFLQQLHQLTGANIAASTRVVGNTDAGSNWTLDASVGQVGSAIAFSAELQQLYVGHFNTAPVAVDDFYSVVPGDTLSLVFEPDRGRGTVVENDSDADADPLTPSVLTDVSNGTLTFRENGSFDYTPDPGFTGTDSFTYQVSDGNGGTDTATVTIAVTDGPFEVSLRDSTD